MKDVRISQYLMGLFRSLRWIAARFSAMVGLFLYDYLGYTVDTVGSFRFLAYMDIVNVPVTHYIPAACLFLTQAVISLSRIQVSTHCDFNSFPCIYERVYLPIYKVTETPFQEGTI